MAFLLQILVAVTIISLCSAQCMMEQNGKIVSNAHKPSKLYQHKPRGCWNDGQIHQVGHEWKSKDCTTCTCNADHIMCCANYAKPILTDPENCVAILNKENCQIEVKRKDNTRTVCEIESWIA